MKPIRDLSIGGKASVAFASVIVAFLVSSGLCLYSVWAIDQKQKAIADSEDALLSIKDGTADYLNIVWAVLANNLDGQTSHKQWIDAHGNDFPARLAQLKSFDPTPQGTALAADARDQYRAWQRNVVGRLVAMRKQVDDFSVGISDLSALTEHFGAYLGTEKLIGSMQRLEDYERSRIARGRQQLDALRKTMYASILVASLAAVLAALVAGRWLTRSIRVPLHRAVEATRAIAGGHLGVHIDALARDEAGQMVNELRMMQDALAAIVDKVRSGCESVNTGSSQIAAGSVELSDRTEQQAASLEETASSMAELTQTVAQTAENARLASDLSREAATLTRDGSHAVEILIDAIMSINGNSEKIAQITGLIESVAFQTNILALNASVEAARAGEQGRGFAVVAGEVRNLAQSTAAAVKEVKERIANSTSLAASGSEKAGLVRTAMNDVKQSIERVASVIGEIACAAQEQHQGIGQINRAVLQMDEVTQRNAALVEQTAATAQSLDRQAAMLRDAVSVFRLR